MQMIGQFCPAGDFGETRLRIHKSLFPERGWVHSLVGITICPHIAVKVYTKVHLTQRTYLHFL